MVSSDSDNSLLSYYQAGARKGRNQSKNSLNSQQSKTICPLTVLKFSMRRSQFAGSATATLCVLNNRELTALNLGDSGFILFRFDSETNEPYILIKSKEQQHKFNSPYQLTKLPTQIEID